MSESIFVNLSPKINYACEQNDIAVLKELKILNTKDIVWEEVKITMKSSLNFYNYKMRSDLLYQNVKQEYLSFLKKNNTAINVPKCNIMSRKTS